MVSKWRLLEYKGCKLVNYYPYTEGGTILKPIISSGDKLKTSWMTIDVKCLDIAKQIALYSFEVVHKTVIVNIEVNNMSSKCVLIILSTDKDNRWLIN